jgi:hypothetical protein
VFCGILRSVEWYTDVSGRPVGLFFKGQSLPIECISHLRRDESLKWRKNKYSYFIFVQHWTYILKVYRISAYFCFYTALLFAGFILTKLRTAFFDMYCRRVLLANTLPNWKHFCLYTHTNLSSGFGSNVEWESYIGRNDKCMTSVGRKTCQAETIWRACLLVGRYSNSRIMPGK